MTMAEASLGPCGCIRVTRHAGAIPLNRSVRISYQDWTVAVSVRPGTMNGSLRRRRRASVCATSSSTVRALPTSCRSAGRAAVPAGDRDESADSRKQPPKAHYGTPVARHRFPRPRQASSTMYNTLGPNGVPPGGAGDQRTGIRRPGTVAAPDRLSNSLYRDASSADTPMQIAMGLEPEHIALDPLHHVEGHDLAPAHAARTHSGQTAVVRHRHGLGSVGTGNRDFSSRSLSGFAGAMSHSPRVSAPACRVDGDRTR